LSVSTAAISVRLTIPVTHYLMQQAWLYSVFDTDLAIVLHPFALSHEKRPFNTSRLSVRLHQLGSQRTNLSHSGTENFYENLSQEPLDLVKIGKKYRTLHTKTCNTSILLRATRNTL